MTDTGAYSDVVFGLFRLLGYRFSPRLALPWNTIYIEAALNQLRKEGYAVRDEDAARLSPLVHEHLNVLGRYSFSMAVAKAELQSLRNPAQDPD